MKLIRTDRASLASHSRRTPEGYIEDRPIVTRTGVFPYMNADGSIRHELRHPDDVFAADSIASLAMLPVTLGHPAGMVNADNAKTLAVGFTGETPQVDGPYLRTAVRVTDGEAVRQVEAGLRELSLGYSVELVDEEGAYNGKPYTHRQTGIRYNHLALVSEARAGAMARLNMDAADQVDEPGIDPQRKDHSVDNLVGIRLDSGIEYKGSPEVAHAIDALRKDNTDKAAALAAATARADKAEAERDAAAEKLVAAEKRDTGAEIATAVKARLALLKAGESAGITADKLDGMTDREIREAVIRADSPKAELEGRSDDYIAARFDAAIEGLAGRATNMADQRKAAIHRADGKQEDRGDAYEKYVGSLDYRTRQTAKA